MRLIYIVRILCAGIVLAALVAGCVPVLKGKPDDILERWQDKTLFEDRVNLYSVGFANRAASVPLGRYRAVAQATDRIIKKSGLTPEKFAFLVEAYAQYVQPYKELPGTEVPRMARSRAFIQRADPIDWKIRRYDDGEDVYVLLRLKKKDYKKLLEEKDKDLSVDFYVYYEKLTGGLKEMREGSRLGMKDGFTVFVGPSYDSYIYLYKVGPKSGAYRLFPNVEFGTGVNPVFASSSAWLPNRGELYELNEETGYEYLYVIVSPEKIPMLEAQSAMSISRDGLDEIIRAQKIGVTVPVDRWGDRSVMAPAHKGSIAKISKKLISTGPVVYRMWFNHTEAVK